MKQQHIFRLMALLLVLLFAVSGAATAFAAGADTSPTDLTSVPDWPAAPELETNYAILMEANTGVILYAKNDTEQHHPASITKLMTALLTLENCSLDDTVTFSYRATHELEEGATSIARTEGEQLSVRDCLYALLLASANEVAQALAEHISGSIEAFADLMNQRAEQLGCTGTHFTNPSGLNDDQHVTTCRDMALITQELLKNKDFLEIESHTTYTIPATNKHSEPLVIAQKHKLVKQGGDHYEGAIAGKTGYTTQTGNTLVTCAQRNDETLICVVMGCSGTHYRDTVSLLDYGFNNFSTINISASESPELTGSDGSPVSLPAGTYIPDDEWLTLPRSMDFAGLTATVELYGNPLQTGVTVAGQAGSANSVGRIHYSHKGSELGTALLLQDPAAAASASSAAETATTAEAASSGKNSLRRIASLAPISALRSWVDQHAKQGGPSGTIFLFIRNHSGASALIFLLLLVLLILILRLIFVRIRRPAHRHHNAYHLPGEHRRKRRRKKGYHMKR